MTELDDALINVLRPMIARIVEEEMSLLAPFAGPWLTTEQAAEYLGISAHAVRQRVYAGTLKAHRDGGNRLRFHRDNLAATMREV